MTQVFSGVVVLTIGTAVVVHLLEAGGTGAGVRLVAGETQVAAASVVGAAAVPAACRRDGDTRLSVCDRLCIKKLFQRS